MDNIAKFVSIEKDAAYMIGREQEKEAAETRFVKNLLAKMSLTTEQVADIAGVSVEFVKNIEQKLSSGK